MSDPVFDIKGLTVAYESPDGRDNIVVWQADLTLHAGTIVGLAGESGCGKSTTALASIGYRAPGTKIRAGAAVLDGVDLIKLPTSEVRPLWGKRVAYVAQNASTALNPAMPIGTQLAQPLQLHMDLTDGELKDRQLELLEAVNIPDPPAALKRYPHQFSGGQQQRIAIAIAISCRPDVLLLDEPTTGLDVTTQAKISELLRAIVADTGVATLYVSHDLALLSTVVDRLAIMYAGEVVEVGSADAVGHNPRHPYSRALLAAVPSVRRRRAVDGIPGRPPPSVVMDACAYAPRCPYVIDECRSDHVSMHPVDGGVEARCIRIDEIEVRPVKQSGVTDHEIGAPFLEVADVTSGYTRTGPPVVRGVSFEVADGETLGIVGESGSGKSTLLRGVAGLHPPREGSIRLEGDELAPRAVKRPRAVRRKIQLVFQNPDSSLNPRQTVFDIVKRPIRLFRDDVDRGDEQSAVAELLEQVKLPSQVLYRYPGELSGGQKQRIALARAFAAKPSLLLCDEVTSSLDVSVQATVIELLADLSSQFGTSVVFVSHDLAVIRTIANRAIVMRNGEVCEAGDTEQLFTDPEHPYTRGLLSAIPDVEDAGRQRA